MGLTEVGRQPWSVCGVMRTADALSRLAAFLLVYGVLGAVAVSLMVRHARSGPAAG